MCRVRLPTEFTDNPGTGNKFPGRYPGYGSVRALQKRRLHDGKTLQLFHFPFLIETYHVFNPSLLLAPMGVYFQPSKHMR